MTLTKAQRRAAKAAAAASSAPTAPAAPESAVAKPAAPKVVTKVVGTLKVKTEAVSLRGARQAWFEVLKAHDGKPAQGYLDATAEKPPSLPKSGRAEAPSGWLRWFVRNGFATIVTTATQPEQAA